MSNIEAGLTIRAVAARTGVTAASLRAWEQRHGFPRPDRLEGGHRRYSEAEVDRIQRVLAERATGLSLESAIRRELDRSSSEAAPADTTLFAGLRRVRPDLTPHVISRRAMLAISRAIEDECCARGDRPHLVAAFQRASTYRRARERRWRALSRTAGSTIVFADFDRSRVASSGVREIAIPAGAPQEREWAVVCDGPMSAAVLAGWERPDGRFEALWSVEPAAVHLAAELGRDLARRHAPGLDVPAPRSAPDALDHGSTGLQRAVDVTNRAIAYMDGAGPDALR